MLETLKEIDTLWFLWINSHHTTALDWTMWTLSQHWSWAVVIVLTFVLLTLRQEPRRWWLVAIGVACVVFCFLYTTHLSYLGLGDILVLLFFGVIPVCIPYYLETHRMGLNVLLASVACGMVIDTLLVVNNYRDIENDRKNDKMTLIVRVGTKGGRLLYLFLGIAACILGAVHICDNRPLAFFLPLIYLVIHFFTYLHMVKVDHGRALNKILGETARNMFFYGLLVAIGILLS